MVSVHDICAINLKMFTVDAIVQQVHKVHFVPYYIDMYIHIHVGIPIVQQVRLK